MTLSSAEAGLVALGKLAIEILGVRSMAVEWEMTAEEDPCQWYSDASATLSIAKRQAGGCQDETYQCQQSMPAREVTREDPATPKDEGRDNPADRLKKHVPQLLARKYAWTIATKLSSDRAHSAFKLSN